MFKCKPSKCDHSQERFLAFFLICKSIMDMEDSERLKATICVPCLCVQSPRRRTIFDSNLPHAVSLPHL